MTSFSIRFIIITGFAFSLPLATMSSDRSLSFDQAWEQAQQHNPDLAAARSHVEAAESATTQAGTRPNPELSLEAENFGGSGANSGWDSAETTLLISQPVETGGKRRARSAEALAGTALSKSELTACQLDLWYALVVRYAEALQAGEQESLADENVRLTGERYRLVSQRVQAGKVAPLEATRAAVESDLAGAGQSKAHRQTLLAYRQLAALLGMTQPDFTTLDGRLDSVREGTPPPSAADSHTVAPDLIRAQKEYHAKQASLQREKAQAYPDVVLSAGLRQFEETGDTAWIGGISLPLPLFNRNRGGIQQARLELSRAGQLQQAAILKQHLAQEEWRVVLENAWSELVVLRDKALPAARDAMEKAKTGYEQGKFSYLEWVDAEHSFVTLRARWITTLTEFHKARAALGRLSGNTAGLTFFK
jgi:cobalt-zinc-cadmium efflux system outer membrane protein